MPAKKKVDIKKLKKELAALLQKHNVYISFEFDDCSDTHGMTGARIAIREENGGIVFDTHNQWDLSYSDLK